jgi:hypothetical protein
MLFSRSLSPPPLSPHCLSACLSLPWQIKAAENAKLDSTQLQAEFRQLRAAVDPEVILA